MPASLAACNATATAAALDGETAMPSTFLATRSCTICTCSSPPPCSPGPIYMHSKAPFDSASAFLQPSRAWSKKGLFMFFGTRAKVYFAWAPETAITIAPSATAAISSFLFILTFSSWVEYPAGLPPAGFLAAFFGHQDCQPSGENRFAAGLHAQKNRENDEGADEGAL